jgi:hypothetical protein
MMPKRSMNGNLLKSDFDPNSTPEEAVHDYKRQLIKII